MSREIKFRVWSEDQKTYDYKFPYNSIGDFYVSSRGKVFSDFGNTIVPEVRQEAFVVEQYTGLKDENGKEIYEGDIVKIGGEYAPIVFDETKGSFMGHFIVVRDGRKIEYNDYIFDFCPDDIMIVGNIHENHELLGDEK